jgi:hypothetical protein
VAEGGEDARGEEQAVAGGDGAGEVAEGKTPMRRRRASLRSSFAVAMATRGAPRVTLRA